MRIRHLSNGLAFLLAIAVLLMPATVAGEEKCTSDTQACLTKMVEKLKNKGWVGINLDKADDGLVITAVEDNSPAQRAGLQKGDVLLALNGISYADDNHDKMAQTKKLFTPGNTITYTISRPDCKNHKACKKDVDIELASLPDEILAKWVGSHMIDHAGVALASK
jgi:C-terminal processing protease CtpA/Prc